MEGDRNPKYNKAQIHGRRAQIQDNKTKIHWRRGQIQSTATHKSTELDHKSKVQKRTNPEMKSTNPKTTKHKSIDVEDKSKAQ